MNTRLERQNYEIEAVPEGDALHILHERNGWLLEVGRLKVEYVRQAWESREPSYSLWVSANCWRVRKDGTAGDASCEVRWYSQSALPQWVIDIVKAHQPEWFELEERQVQEPVEVPRGQGTVTAWVWSW